MGLERLRDQRSNAEGLSPQDCFQEVVEKPPILECGHMESDQPLQLKGRTYPLIAPQGSTSDGKEGEIERNKLDCGKTSNVIE
jgi:hypothetical protein